MKVCHMEVAREIRLPEDEKAMLLGKAGERFRVSYKESTSKVAPAI